MTTNQILHHAEQIEASRVEFARVFQDQIIPAMAVLDIRVADARAIQHFCWMVWREARNRQKTQNPS